MADDDFLASLDSLVADAVARDTARQRSQERVLRTIAEAEATFAGLALDLAERAVTVIVRTASGRAHRGAIVAVGRDFLVVRDGSRPPVFVPVGAVASMRPEPGTDAGDTAGARTTPLDVSLVALLSELSAERPRVQAGTAGDEPVAGELRSVGVDVVTIRLDGDRRLLAYVPAAALTELVLFDL